MAVETFEYNGQPWKRVTHKPSEQFFVGVDLGCSIDPTAICVMRATVTTSDEFKITRRKNPHTWNMTEQKTETHLDIVHLERVPLGTEYPVVADHIVSLLNRPPLAKADPPPDLIVDATGVGLPVVQILETKGLQPIKVTITAGAEQTRAASFHWHVAKSILISQLDAALHTGVLRFAAALLEGAAMREELANFKRHVGTAGRATYAARVGTHDDLVLAVALVVWRACGNGPGGITTGPLKGWY